MIVGKKKDEYLWQRDVEFVVPSSHWFAVYSVTTQVCLCVSRCVDVCVDVSERNMSVCDSVIMCVLMCVCRHDVVSWNLNFFFLFFFSSHYFQGNFHDQTLPRLITTHASVTSPHSSTKSTLLFNFIETWLVVCVVGIVGGVWFLIGWERRWWKEWLYIFSFECMCVMYLFIFWYIFGLCLIIISFV